MRGVRSDQARRRRRGYGLIEFTIIGIPVIFLTISIIEVALAMWQYHTLAYSVGVTTRYVITHGRTCGQNVNACTVTLGNVASVFEQQAIALDPTKVNLTLYTQTATTTCNPLSTCLSSSTQFPSATDNGVNLDVKLVATYPIANPFPFFWPGSSASSGGTFTLGATSRQRIVF